MRLFKTFDDLTEAELVAHQMRAKGIMIHIANRNTRNLGAIGAGPLNVGLWVVLDDQYEDSRLLYENPEHVVFDPLTEDQMRQLTAQAENARGMMIQRILNVLMITITSGLLLWVGLTVWQ